MKKFILILSFLMFVFAGCASDESVPEDPQIDPDLVTVEVTESSNKDISIEITNNSNMVLFYGEPYTLEYLKNGEWKEVSEREETFFTLAAHGVLPGESAKWSAKLERRYGTLSDGTYRIVKSVNFQNDMGEDCANQNIYAEFEVIAIKRG